MNEHLYKCPTPLWSWEIPRQHPRQPGLVQSRQVAMLQGRLVWKSLSLSAMQQRTSTFPSPLLASSSLSIYPPIVSANNRVSLHIYSIYQPGILERATKHQ